MAKDNNRALVVEDLAKIKKLLVDLKDNCQTGELSKIDPIKAQGEVIAKLETIIDEFKVVETRLIPRTRERKQKQYKKTDGSVLLTFDVFNDLRARLTIREIIEKYKISTAATFYQHLKNSSLGDLDIIKLKQDKHYQAQILSKLSKNAENEIF